MIWCVEDDSSIRDIEVYALTSTGFEAKGFEDGDSFWDALQSQKPELIVLDVMLPGKDGVTLLKLMKANEAFADIPVIMATAKGTEYDKIQSLDLGADDYLVKPFGIMEMVSRVKAVLRRCKPAQENKLIRLRNIESFAVHFFTFKLNIFINTLCDRMLRHYCPESFSVIISPFKSTGCTHCKTEGF